MLTSFFVFKSYAFTLQKLCFGLSKAILLRVKSYAFVTRKHRFYISCA